VVLGGLSGDHFLFEEVKVLASFPEALSLPASVVAVDMPIGLPEGHQPGGRTCDRLARRLLGRRGVCVFTPPPRSIFKAKSYEEAKRLLKGHLSRQTWNILPKVKEVDQALTPEHQERIFETHPELVFFRLSGNPLPSKHTEAGFKLRLDLLRKTGLFRSLEDNLARCSRGLRLDLLDAYAALLSAKRIFTGEAERLPPQPERDARGLRMEIWY